MEGQKIEGNVIGGHKATLKNPNVSERAKENSRQWLEEHGSETRTSSGEIARESESNVGKNEGNFVGGHKATLKNPRVSDEAKEHSRQVLEEHGAL